jgi:hypothetical protein
MDILTKESLETQQLIWKRFPFSHNFVPFASQKTEKVTMEEIDFSPSVPIDGLAQRAQDFLTLHLYGDIEKKAQELVIDQLKKVANSKYLLLKNICIEGLDEPIPLLLLGPTGVIVIYPTAVKGVFQAKDINWFEMKGKSRQFEPSRPNLVQNTVQAVKAVSTRLQGGGLSDLEVQGVIIFTNTATHVETVRPPVRIVLSDSIKRFCANIVRSPILMTGQELENLKRLFTGEKYNAENEQETHFRDQFDLVDNIRTPKKSQRTQIQASPDLSHLTKKFKMTPRQWILLGVMGTFQIFLLMGIILLFITAK